MKIYGYKVEKKMKQKRYRALCVLLSTLLLASGTLTGCGSGQASGVSKETQTEDSAKKSSSNKSTSNKEKAPVRYRIGAFLNIIYFFLSHGKGSETNIVPSST